MSKNPLVETNTSTPSIWSKMGKQVQRAAGATGQAVVTGTVYTARGATRVVTCVRDVCKEEWQRQEEAKASKGAK